MNVLTTCTPTSEFLVLNVGCHHNSRLFFAESDYYLKLISIYLSSYTSFRNVSSLYFENNICGLLKLSSELWSFKKKMNSVVVPTPVHCLMCNLKKRVSMAKCQLFWKQVVTSALQKRQRVH